MNLATFWGGPGALAFLISTTLYEQNLHADLNHLDAQKQLLNHTPWFSKVTNTNPEIHTWFVNRTPLCDQVN